VRIRDAETRRLAAVAERAGWTVEPTRSGHLRFRGPDGQVVVHSTTSSDWRAARNLRAQLRRAGLDTTPEQHRGRTARPRTTTAG
jgi:hypothetical protein